MSIDPNSPELIWVRSPGGWRAPEGRPPGWNWFPPGGGAPRADRMPWWLRFAYRVPFLDRLAHEWMWWRGGWDVLPFGGVVIPGEMIVVEDEPPGSSFTLYDSLEWGLELRQRWRWEPADPSDDDGV